MKLCLCLLIIFGTSSVLAQTESRSADEKELIALEQQMGQMEKMGNYPQPFVQDHLGADLIWAWPMGFGGRDSFTQPDPPDQLPLEEKIENLKVRLYGNTAVVDATWYKKGKDPAAYEMHGFLVDVWIKREGKWQLVSGAAGPLGPGASLKPLGAPDLPGPQSSSK